MPIKLCKTAGSIHFFEITGIFMPDKVKINKHYIWDIVEIDWKEVKVTFNGKMINLSKSGTIKLQDKFRHMKESQPLLFHLMLKQGFNSFTLASKDTRVEKCLQVKIKYYRNGMRNQPCMQLHIWINQDLFTKGHNRCTLDYVDGERDL